MPRVAQLVCTRQEFADLWQEVMGTAWASPDTTVGEGLKPSSTKPDLLKGGIIDPQKRQTLRDAIDAIVAHLYGLTRDEFEHILGTFPLVFPDDAEGQAKKARLLGVYDDWTGRL